MSGIFELEMSTDAYSDMYASDVISGLLHNGYTLCLTPCRYTYGNDEESYTLMVEIGEIDPSWIDEPTESVED